MFYRHTAAHINSLCMNSSFAFFVRKRICNIQQSSCVVGTCFKVLSPLVVHLQWGTLTVRQRLHRLSKAFEVRVPKGLLRRHSPLGFKLEKRQEGPECDGVSNETQKKLN